LFTDELLGAGVLLAWLDRTFVTRTVPPRAITRPTTMAMINRSTMLLLLA